MQLLVNIDVDDLEAGISFYEKGLALQLSRKLFGGTVAEMAGGESSIYLIENAAGSAAVSGTTIPRDYGRHWTPVHLDFVVEDVDAAVKQSVMAGARQEGEIQTFPWGKLVAMSDPFGHGFCLLQFVGKGYELRLQTTRVPLGARETYPAKREKMQ